MTGCWLCGVAVKPMPLTAEPDPAPTVALATDSDPALPSDPVGYQVPPVPVLV